MIAAMIFLHYISHAEDVHPNKPFSTFPKQIGEWTSGNDARFEDRVMAVLGVDDYILRNYYNSEGRNTQLYIGFYQSQREGDLIHSPKNCMPGAGWSIVRTSVEELTMPGTPKNIKVIKLNLKKGTQKQLMLYWFQSRGRIISSEYMQKIYLVVDSISRHRTDGSFVRLIAPVVNDDENAAFKQLSGFIEKLMPVLYDYIPS
ncbi:MAG: EpsI family protein [Desulfobacteraceae bacterium]|nr:EpsI family protein [Desulfobacteraceae bacterium]